MPTADDRRATPVVAARSAAGRFRSAAAGRVADRGDDLRRYRAAQRRLQPREERFAHLKARHD